MSNIIEVTRCARSSWVLLSQRYQS